MLGWEYAVALHAKQGNRASSPARGMSHGMHRVAAGTWGIFSSYSKDGNSKLHFVQGSQDSCLVTTMTSEIYTRLGRRIQTLLEVRC